MNYIQLKLVSIDITTINSIFILFLFPVKHLNICSTQQYGFGKIIWTKSIL
jgi:hypothetical protein